jgi:hypothetical protein
MSTLDGIKAEIKSIAESVTGIGNIFEQVPAVSKWDEVLKEFIVDGKLNILLFTKNVRNPQNIDEHLERSQLQHKWIFKYFYSSNSSEESEKTFDNICELICNTFDTNKRLNNAVNRKMPMSQPMKQYVMITNILCHYAEFELITYVDSIETTSVPLPGQVILSSPADGYTSGDISNADFAWLAPANAVSYHFQISTTPNFVSYYEQDNILYLKHTVIEGILNNAVQYYWRVRARNTAGYGAWSAARSWLASSGIAPLTEAETGADFLIDAALGVTEVDGKVTVVNDQIGTFHLTKSGNIDLLKVIEPTTGKPALWFNPTAIGQFACLAKLDPTNLFKIAGTETKSIGLTLIVSNTVASNMYGLSIGGRTNINLGDQWVIGCPDVGLNIKPFYIGFPRGHASTTLNAVEGITIPSVRLIHLIYVVENLVIKTYVDGQLRCTHNNFSSEVLLPDGNASNAFLLGAKRTNNQGSAPFNGYLFKCPKWPKALTAAEVAGIHKAHTNYFGI